MVPAGAWPRSPTHGVVRRVGQFGRPRAADQLQRERGEAVALGVAGQPRGGGPCGGTVPVVVGLIEGCSTHTLSVKSRHRRKKAKDVLVADALRAGGGADAGALGCGRGRRDLGGEGCVGREENETVTEAWLIGNPGFGGNGNKPLRRAAPPAVASFCPPVPPRRVGAGGGCMLDLALWLLPCGGRGGEEERGTSWPVLGSTVCVF